jgi:hypothetical protein
MLFDYITRLQVFVKKTNWYTNIIMKAIKADPQLPEIIAAASNSASDELAVSFKLTAIRSIEDR